MENKIYSLLGFAQKSKNLFSGENTCEIYIKKKVIKLIIIAEDASHNTLKKMINLCNSNGIPYIIFGNRDMLSKSIGKINRTVLGIKDENFVKKILEIAELLNIERSV
ncbi:L7Ae/L30e/S12e/Gadd45 family ribosomal protein [Caminicella sporogenes]|uniref:L7Ae/L30e/S12e/Gadd45 family ribosomal protein n=1 Tax=Caminicella sporogenes TaxID=166485 RepID=UPI002541313C|nr:L7Ae/L30e/S12e/Gadd45 family ribosomal protein [Caminicella sporogenes]WIF94680.1 L7Ae/L30e/S12e/Gadd45 family ribosomal protein [Caminicella sporogenes]